jgi:hypothetical protein
MRANISAAAKIDDYGRYLRSNAGFAGIFAGPTAKAKAIML